MELVYNRVTDEVECFYNTTSMGTVAVSSAYRDFTKVVVALTENYLFIPTAPPMYQWGQLDVDDILISNTP